MSLPLCQYLQSHPISTKAAEQEFYQKNLLSIAVSKLCSMLHGLISYLICNRDLQRISSDFLFQLLTLILEQGWPPEDHWTSFGAQNPKS